MHGGCFCRKFLFPYHPYIYLLTRQIKNVFALRSKGKHECNKKTHKVLFHHSQSTLVGQVVKRHQHSLEHLLQEKKNDNKIPSLHFPVTSLFLHDMTLTGVSVVYDMEIKSTPFELFQSIHRFILYRNTTYSANCNSNLQTEKESMFLSSCRVSASLKAAAKSGKLRSNGHNTKMFTEYFFILLYTFQLNAT